MKNLKIKYVSLLFWVIFISNSIFYMLYFQIFGNMIYSYETCFDLNCFQTRFFSLYIYYILVFFLFSGAYCFLLSYFNLYKTHNKVQVAKWILLILILFIFGYFIYGINKFYQGIWMEYPFLKWSYIVFKEYLYDISYKYAFLIVLMISVTVTATLLLNRKESRKNEKDNLV
jgi:ABC-type Na+ efflux pump permease subunit